MQDPIRAVREQDADGEIAAVFTDLRGTLGVPFVNLIWRHIATLPGGLAWMWQLSKPLYISPDLERAATELRVGLSLPRVEPLSDMVLDCVGLDRMQRSTIACLIDAYNRANANNFLAMLAACAVLAGENSTGSTAATSHTCQAFFRSPGKSSHAVPHLLGLDELPPAVLSLVMELDTFARIRPSDAVASLYRHLAHWPPFLALAHTALLPHHRAGTLTAEQERTVTQGRLLAGKLTPVLASPAQSLEAETRQRVLAALEEFTQLMIGRMVVMGAALFALIPEGHPSAQGNSLGS